MKINLRESLNKIDLATNNKYDLLNTFDSKKLSDNSKKKLAEAIENNSIASINRVLHESEEKVFTVKVYQDYPFVAEVIDNSIVDKNGEGKVLKKFTNRDALDDFAGELFSKGYVNYQGYSKNKSLHESEEQLYKVVISSGATKRNFESALYEDEAEEIVDYYGGRWIDENGFEWNMHVEEDDESAEHAYEESLNESADSAINVFHRGSEEYFKLDKVASWLTYFSPNNVYYAVEQTYFDYGQDWKWTTIIAYRSNGDSWQAINPKQQESILACTTDEELEEVAKDILRESRLDKGFNESLPSRYWEPEDDRTDEEEYQDWLDKGAIPNYDDEEPPFESLKEASYGGAYDIEDDMFFTKEEIVEFADEICEYLGDIFGYQYDINNVYMDGPRKLYINIYDNNYIEVESTFDIDMRKIRKPSDLSKVYGLTIENWFQKAFAREYRDAGLDESLTEDTVKQNGKWVNKGSEGTHGKFKTKKAADAQRKAMFANGYKAESLNEQKYSSGNYFLTVDKTGMGPHYSLYYQHPHSDYDGLMFIVDGYGYNNFKEKLSKFSTVYPNKDVQNLLKNINEDKLNDKSLSEKLIPAPQEVVDELLSILEKYNFVLDDSLKNPIGKTWSGNTHVQVINKDSNIEETDDPDIYSEQLMSYVPDSMENEIDKLSDKSGCRITYNFGINRNWQVTGGLDVWEKHVPGLQDESLDEQINLPGYAVKYTSGYAGNGVNNSETEWFRTEEERDRRVKELKDKNYTEIKTWKMDNFYHTLPKDESLNEDYEYLYNQPFLKTFDEFVSKVSGLKADELEDDVWNEYFYDYQVYNEKYKVKDFENKLRKSLEEKDLKVISIEPNETATLVTVEFDGIEKKFRFKFRLFDVNDSTEEYYIHYIVSMIAGYFGLNESLKEDYKKLFGYNMLSSTLKDGGDTYALLRKTEDGKTKWAAAKYVNGIPDEDNIFEITYEQARGFEPLTDAGKVSRKLGKALLPKKESLKEDLSDLDLILNIPTDTKQFNEETFKALKNLVSEYKKDLDSLDQWASENEKEPFVKKWYKLADKCQEIAKNGVRGITGYGRLNDFIKFKVVDLARLVDNTFPWYTKNNLAKFNKLESLKEAIDDEIDLDYETDFDDDGVEEGNVFTEGGVEYAWIQREAGPLYLDFDKWAVWSAREYVDPREFMTIHDDGKGYDFDGDAFKEKAMAAPITYFVVDEDTGFIDWGPEDNEIAAKDFLNGKKEDWENDMDESLKNKNTLNESAREIGQLFYSDIDDEGNSYVYEPDYDKVIQFFIDMAVYPDFVENWSNEKLQEWANSDEYTEWLDYNYYDLFEEYYQDLLYDFEDDAREEWFQENGQYYSIDNETGSLYLR